MDLGLKGKKAIVTGGTRGIGRAVCELLAADGCDIGLCARQEDQVNDAVAAMQAKGVNAIGGVLDITEAGALASWIDDAAAALGGVDILVANVSALAEDLGEDGWRAAFETDVIGSVRAYEAALPHLRKSESGSAVFIASTAAVEIMTGARPYGAIKAALINWAKGLARDMASEGVRVNVVSPGTIYFDDGVWGRRKREQPAVYEFGLSKNPMGRMGGPFEVAHVVTFVASPAAGFVTGSNIVVDGALTQRVQF